MIVILCRIKVTQRLSKNGIDWRWSSKKSWNLRRFIGDKGGVRSGSVRGDANTNFFHLVANGRRRKKTITVLESDGESLTEQTEIQAAIYTYYRKLFGIQQENNVTLGEGAWADYGRLSLSDNEILLQPILEEELKATIFGMKEDTAPGPDGYTVTFYKRFWHILKDELLALMNDFFLGQLDIARLNYGVITLVPKVTDAKDVKQFRPICLLNVSFKIFTRLLMGRLDKVADKLISPSQTAFIKGRFIYDGAVMLHEVVHELKQKKLQGVLLKIDFEKAYDSISWKFVERVLQRKGFDNRLTQWIMSTVRGGECVSM